MAVLVAIESGDTAALEAVREIRGAALNADHLRAGGRHSPDFDTQVGEAGADTVFAKPVPETEIVEALVVDS